MTGAFAEGEYARLLNPREIKASPIHFDWTYQGVHLRLWQDAPRHNLAYSAQTGICWDNIRGLPVVGTYTRIEGKTARFVSVLDPSKAAPRVRSFRSDADKIVVQWIDGTTHTIRVRSAAQGDESMKLER